MLCQCPECDTVFRIQHDALERAGGKVRCGVCGAVFDAYDSLSPEGGEPGADHSEPAPPPREPEPAETGAGLEPELDLDITPPLELPPDTEAELPPLAATAEEEADLTATLEADLLAEELREAAAASRRGARLLWGLGALLLSVLLGLQVMYVFRDRLAADPAWRPWVERLCRVTGCQVPFRKDTSRIRLLQRDVTLDPANRNILHVQAMFTNQAPFVQPYPVVQITLSDFNNRVVAIRRLKPEEYVPAEQIPQGMPPGKAVELSIDFIRPSRPVSTFEFEFL